MRIALRRTLPPLNSLRYLLVSLEPTTNQTLFASPAEPPCPFPPSKQPSWCRYLPSSRIPRVAEIRPFCSSSSENGAAVPRSVPVGVAHELLQSGHRYLDVRTAEEFNAGHAVGAVNIPYMFKVGEEMVKNPKFLDEVSQMFRKDDDIIVGCKSGRRSIMAAKDMTAAGFAGVTDVSGGYSDWIENGLPTQLPKVSLNCSA